MKKKPDAAPSAQSEDAKVIRAFDGKPASISFGCTYCRTRLTGKDLNKIELPFGVDAAFKALFDDGWVMVAFCPFHARLATKHGIHTEVPADEVPRSPAKLRAVKR